MIWLWLLVALTIITLVGHGIWALLAFTLRALFNLQEPEIKTACPHCHRQTSARREPCEWCGRPRHVAASTEMADVAAVERQLERWRTRGQLTPSEAGGLMTRVKAYQQSLAAGASAAPLPAVPMPAAPMPAAPMPAAPMPAATMPASPTPTAPFAAPPVQGELARLLRQFSELPPADQQRALEIYDRMTPTQRSALALSVQIDLARLLARLGRVGDAIGVYGRVTEIHTNQLGKGRMALEAMRFGIQRNRPADAARFLVLLDQLALPQLQAEKEQLARALRVTTADHAQEPVAAEIVEAALAVSSEPPRIGRDPLRAADLPIGGVRDTELAARPTMPAAARTEQRPAPAKPQPATPRRSLAEVLSTFMEERNIRWGELVGGLLIVCSSVALVISLWETLKTIPYFQFFIFVGVSAALFGVGLYTEHRWKLASTSRGILIISTLLVPLNFVAMAGTARTRWDLPAALTELAALAIFTVLVRQAGRVLVDGWHTWLTLAVVGGSGILLTVPHQPALGWAVILAAPAVALAAAGVGRAVIRLARRERVAADDAHRLFILLGCVMFTVAVALGLIVARSADRPAALNVLAPLIALSGTLVAVCGLFVMRATGTETDEAGLRTTSTAVGLVGAAVMLAAVGLAWPLPAPMIAVALFDFAALACFAVRYRLAALHALANACLSLAYVAAAHVALGNLPPLERADPNLTLRLFASAQTGTSLVGLFLALAAAAEFFSRRRRPSDALAYVGGCGVVAAVSLSLVAARGHLSGNADAWRAAAVFAIYGVGCLALNVRWRRPLATYGGAALVGGALIYAIAFTGTVDVPYRWLAIALAQATWTIVASVLFDRSRSVAPAFVQPLRQSGVFASLLAVATFAWFDWQQPLVLAIDLGWLAALWLLLAIVERSPGWFAAFQSAVYAAAAFAITSWLNDQSWVANDPRGLLHPRSLQVYGIGWGLIGLLWTVLRAALRDRPLLATIMRQNLVPVDRLVQGALIVGSLAMAAGGALPGIEAEFFGNGRLGAVAGVPVGALQDHAYGAAGWILAGVLAAAVFAALWQKWGKAQLIGGVLLLVNVALLVAGPVAASWATASALRWSLAAAFVIGSLSVWFRAPLARIAARCQCRIDLDAHAADLAAGLLIALTAAPVVCFSALAATLQILGEGPAGPLPGIWLANVGLSVSHLIPLALVVLGLVGYAVRERSPGYAFAAGIVANLTVTGGYALNLPQFGATEAARLAQLATITAAVWAIGWLAVRKRVLAIGGRTESPAAWPLLRLQAAQSAVGNLALLLSAFALVAIDSPMGAGSSVHDWVAAAGSPIGWLTLVLACAAGGMGAWLRGRTLRPEVVGLLGMTVLGLAACSVEAMLPGTPWPYRTLMLGWATYALSVAAATWWATVAYAPAGAEGPPAALVRAAAVWVRVAGLLALMLGLKTVAVGGPDANEPLWGAAAIGIASAAAAAMAVWQRREAWAFTAGLGVNLAASIVVWHRLAIENLPVAAEWTWLLQANLIAAAVVALLWLAARRRMYAARELSISGSPFLTLQTASIALGNLLLVGFAVLELVVKPGSTGEALTRYGSPAGWFAWLLGSAAIAIHLFHVARRELVHFLATCLLGVGVLAAVETAQTGVAWQAYHALIVAWSAAAFGLLVAGWLAGRHVAEGPSSSMAAAWRWLKLLAPAREIEAWLAIVEMALAALAVRGAASDPLRPWWPMAAALAASGLAAGQATWRRKPQHVYSSGLLANLAASLFWYAQETAAVGDLLLLNAAALAVMGGFWSLTSRWIGAMEPVEPSEKFPPFEHAAAAVSVALIAAVAWLGWCSSWLAGEPTLTSLRFAFDARLAWIAWAAIIGTLVIALWDRRATFCSTGFYAAGLAAVALALAQQQWTGSDLLWATAPALAGWVLAAALIHALLGVLRQSPDDRPRRWFTAAQSAIACAAASLGVWIALAFDVPADRAAGGASSVLLLAAAACMLRGAAGQRQRAWQMAILSLAVLAPAEGIWAFCDGASPVLLWIHREVALLASLALSIVGCEFFAPLVLPADSPWRRSIRRFLPAAIGLTMFVLAIVLVQERGQYLPHEGVPMALAAKLAVAALLIGLAMLAIMDAVLGQRDPLRLSPCGRTAYVYAAGALAVLVCFHVRTTMPKFVPFGMIENWWTLIVMIAAFCGAGLAEFFERRRLSVLSEPLIRTALFAPLLPAAAPLLALVWLPDELHVWLVEARLFSNEAALFLVAAFYGVQAALKRSPLLGCLAVAAGNAGLWLLWRRLHLEFLVHPQLWLIPPALAALVAEYLNRNRLKPEQSGAVRYLALSTIYVASTADVFISHIDRHISLPLVLVLLGLSIAGVLSGMLLRVRSFLYLGFTFLLVDLSVMVFHAAWDLGHTWVFWSTGIVVGAAIIALFAVFEKRRNDLVLALERFKEWR